LIRRVGRGAPRPTVEGQKFGAVIAPNFFWVTGHRHSTKQLLLAHPDSDIAQKHPTSRFTFTTGHSGQWELSDEGETAAASNTDEIRELTLDELDGAGGGFHPVSSPWWY
jgi:hypothetical protein